MTSSQKRNDNTSPGNYYPHIFHSQPWSREGRCIQVCLRLKLPVLGFFYWGAWLCVLLSVKILFSLLSLWHCLQGQCHCSQDNDYNVSHCNGLQWLTTGCSCVLPEGHLADISPPLTTAPTYHSEGGIWGRNLVSIKRILIMM